MEERNIYALYIKKTEDPRLLKKIIKGFILVTQEFCSLKVVTTKVENLSLENAQNQQVLDRWLSK